MKKMLLTVLVFSLFFSFNMVHAEEEIKLTFWAWGPQVDAVNNAIGPAFQKVHPNVTVEAISMGPWDLMDKFYVAMVSGKGAPDCVQLVRRVSAKYLISELLYDFTDFVEGEHKGEFINALNKDVTSVDGKVLGIALDYGPSVIYYDKKLADDLGIDVSKIVTWDDYYNVAMKISESHPDIYIHPLFYPAGGWGSNQWRFWVQSAGLNIFDDEGKVIRDNARMREVTRFYYKLHTEPHVITGAVNDPSIYDTLRQRKILFWPGSTYRSMEIAQQLPDMKGEMAAIPWPLWSQDAPAYTGNWGGVALVVPKKGPNVEMAAEFVKFYSSSEEALIEHWFGVAGTPAYGPVREKIMQITDRETFAKNLIQSIAVREVPTWNYTDWAQTEKILGDNLDAMFAGNMTPEDAWDKTEEQLIKILGR